MTSTASVTLPVFRAECPTGINLDADRTGAVCVNGNKAKVKKLDDNCYEAKNGGVKIGISLDVDGAPMVTHTGKRGANGVC